MRRSLLILILFITQTTQLVSQEENILSRKYSLSEDNTPVYQVILKLTKKTGYDFSYNSTIIDDEKPITFSLEDYKLKHIIDTLFRDTSLAYDVVKNHIVIHKKNVPLDSSRVRVLKKETTPFTIEGKVLREKKNTPLPFATISLKNHPIGTIANNQGEFVLKIDPKFRTDTLIISFIGYENYSIPVSELTEEKHTFSLREKRYTIQGVIIRTKDPNIILENAINRIEENYHSGVPISLTSFYRETIKKEEQFTSVSEAIIKIYKPNVKLFQSPQIKVLKSRKTINYTRKDSVILKLKAGLDAILFLDIIDEGMSFVNSSERNLYSYSMEDISYFNDKDVYVIGFEPNLKTDMPLYTGKVYVDIKTLAIIGAEFHLNKENLRKISESLIIKKKWDMNVNPKKTSYFVSYKQTEGKYHLNHIRGDLTFKIRKKGQLFGDDFHVRFEMAANNFRKDSVDRFQSKETVKTHKVFIEQVKNYDPSFWGDFNYIKPNEPIKKTIERLNTKIRTLEESN